MLAFLLPILSKVGPYLIAAMLFFSAGSYAGYRWELGAADAAKLALVTQQKNDAAALAQANAQAAAAMAMALDADNAAEAAIAASAKAGAAHDTALTTAIDAQATQPGQDGPVAPVLAKALESLGGSQ
jgi:hypothetical protein